VSELVAELDPFDVRRARDAAGLLRVFNEAGVLAAADIHVTARLTALGGESDESVALAVALAVRAPRLGHVLVDLARIRETAAVDAEEPVDLSLLPWPEPTGWVERVAASRLVARGDEADDRGGNGRAGQAVRGSDGGDHDGGDGKAGEGDRHRGDGHGVVCPLRLVGSWLYLDRYWSEERELAGDLLGLSSQAAAGVEVDALADGLRRMFGEQLESRQCLAAASAVLRRFAVVAGGPGTGKTTTVARIVGLLAEQAVAAGSRPPLIALAAPTGKAAARLEEAVHEEAVKLEMAGEIRDQLLGLHASTLHRLLGWRPGSFSRFRHDHNRRLPHDVVIVDETSMVSLSMMSSLVDAIRPEARLILVGDPGQLVSIEAGAVLGDIVGPASHGLLIGADARAQLAAVTGHDQGESAAGPEPGTGAESFVVGPGIRVPPGCKARVGRGLGDGIVVLDRVYRFGGGIEQLAAAIRRGDADAVIALLADPPADVTWIAVDASAPEAISELEPVSERAAASARGVIVAARAGDAHGAIEALGAFRILCAHRRGPLGVATWTARIEAWLAAEIAGFAPEDHWGVGRPLLVTQNDYELGLYNGDTGVIVQSTPDRVSAAFQRQGEIVEYSPSRLSAVDTVYAMTIHKSQGSQFDTVAALLPGPESRILSRELLYTAATRARRNLILAGSEETIRAAVSQPVARSSGLGWRLWSTDPL
jgi:exodeoxyribonuclease V alpha subunit